MDFSYSYLYLTFEPMFKVINTILVLLSVHSNICVSSGSIAIDWFFSLHYGPYFFASLHAGNFGIDARHCKFYPCWLLNILIFLYIAWALFWSTVKSVGKSLIFWALAFKISKLGSESTHSRTNYFHCEGKTFLCTKEHTKINNKKQSNFKKKKTFEQILLKKIYIYKNGK